LKRRKKERASNLIMDKDLNYSKIGAHKTTIYEKHCNGVPNQGGYNLQACQIK
jgi:hypothetical protein